MEKNMKNLKRFILCALVCITLVSVSIFAVACTNGGGEHKHVWGKWVFEVEPTWDTQGKATRTCTKGDATDTKEDVPALSDSSVWTKDANKSTPATHLNGGTDVYVSVYGEVEVATDPEEHDWGAWVFEPEPTLDTPGKVTRYCTSSDGGRDNEKSVPELSDDEFWTVIEHSDATLEKGERTVYECEYGTVTVEGDPLGLPFANKTYYVGATLDVYTDNGQAQTSSTSSNGKSITLDSTGTGNNGTGTPFIADYTYKFSMVSFKTGEVLITRTSTSGNKAKFPAFIDVDTGVMVMAQYENSEYSSGQFKRVYILVPADTFDATFDSFGGSAWYIDGDYKFAITYTYGNGTEETADDVVHNIYIEGENGDAAYFGVSYKDREGNAVLGKDAYNSSYLYVSDKNGTQIAAYGLKEGKLVEVDGYEGEYNIVLNEDITDEGSTIFLSGFGTVTLTTDDTYTGTYTILKDSTYDLLVAIEELECSYYLVFNGSGSVTLAAVRVTVTFELNGNGSLTEEQLTVFPGFELTLPKPTYDENSIVFKGWYYDSECKNAVEDPFIPMESCTLYAKWTAVPNYVGTFNYGNLSSLNSGSSLSSSESSVIKISAKGVISGKYTGNVTDYDSEEQLITWKDSSNNIKYFIFDEAAGVLITKWNNASGTYFANDIDFFSKYATSVTHYGIKFALPEHTDLNATNPTLRIIELAVDAEATLKTIVVYYNRIYSNVTLSNIEGSALTVSTVKDANSLIVRNATTNAVVLALKAKLDTFNGGGSQYNASETIPLDAYFGSYTDQGGKTLVLDGAGKITYDDKEGTYFEVEEFVIGAYFGEGAALEYYEFTLDGASATVAQPEVEITLDTGDVTVSEDVDSPFNTKKNIPITLPTLTDSTGAYIFDGWFTDEDCRTPVTLKDGKYTPSEDITLYAFWIKKLTIHVHYNNDGVDFAEYWYVGEGKALTLDVPEGVINGLVFDGFYIHADFNDGGQWTNGSVIYESYGITDIYAKWTEPVPYYGKFVGKSPAYSSNGHFSSIYSRLDFEVDAFGNASGFGANANQKLNGALKEYDETTGKLKFFAPATSASYYQGAFDAKNGVIIVDGTTNTSEQNFYLREFHVYFLGATTVTISTSDTSVWEDKSVTYRFETALIKAMVDGEEVNVFIYKHRVWGNVTISSADGSVTAGNAYAASKFSVLDSDGKLVAVYSDGEFGDPDYLYGTYAYASGENLGEIVIDGAGGITAGSRVGTYEITAENTIEATFVEQPEIHVYTIVFASGEYTATVKPVTIVTLTLNYTVGGHSTKESVTISYLSGWVPNLDAYEIDNAEDGYFFTGWYEDDGLSTPYTPSVLTASKTVYAGWSAFKVEDATTASYHWEETTPGTWRVSQGGRRKDVYIKISFAVDGTFTLDWSCYFSDSYDGIFGYLNTMKPETREGTGGGTRPIEAYTGNGTATITVKAGDYFCVCATWYESTGSTEYAQLSNFRFTPAA